MRPLRLLNNVERVNHHGDPLKSIGVQPIDEGLLTKCQVTINTERTIVVPTNKIRRRRRQIADVHKVYVGRPLQET